MNTTTVSWIAFVGLACLYAAAGDFKFTIIHTNDVHARFEQANSVGGTCERADADKNLCFAGVARRYTKIKELQSQYNNTVVLDAGDQYQGTFWFFVHSGNITAHFMKMLGYDAMALGNHEFDLGVPGLAPFVKEVIKKFPVLSCNLNVSREPLLSDVAKYAVLTRGGRKIGVIGYTSVDTPFLTDVSSTATVTFRDDIGSIRAAAAELKQLGVNIIIALGHSGYDVDQKIAAEVDDVDVVVGGHTHSFLYSGTPPSNDVPVGPYPTVIEKPSGQKVVIVQDFFFGKYLGVLEVHFDDDGRLVAWSGAPILLNGSVAEDPDVLRDVERYGETVQARGGVVVGNTSVFLNGTREECRARECNLGNAVSDAFVAAQVLPPADAAERPGPQWTRVSLAVVNSGGIRVSLTKGPIRYSDIFGVLPFLNTVDAVTLRGADVLAMFEQSVARYDLQALAGSFLQVSGFKVVYHMYEPAYSRVASVQARCQQCDVPKYEPLDVNRNYTILMPSFMATGGDNYTVVRDRALKREILGQVDSDLFINYVKATSPMVNGLEQRLQLVFDAIATPTPPIFTPTKEASGARMTMGNEMPVYLTLLSLIVTFSSIGCANSR